MRHYKWTRGVQQVTQVFWICAWDGLSDLNMRCVHTKQSANVPRATTKVIWKCVAGATDLWCATWVVWLSVMVPIKWLREPDLNCGPWVEHIRPRFWTLKNSNTFSFKLKNCFEFYSQTAPYDRKLDITHKIRYKQCVIDNCHDPGYIKLYHI